VVKAIRARFDDIIEANNIHRVQAACRADWPEAVRFAEFLGFENEGLMRSYGVDGRDYFRYARVI
jgi:RimJ/RimL family protein N-acetyltransferase